MKYKIFFLPLQLIIGISLGGGADVTFWNNNKRLLLFGTLLNLAHSKETKTE